MQQNINMSAYSDFVHGKNLSTAFPNKLLKKTPPKTGLVY